MKTIEISVPVTPSLIQLFTFKTARLAAKGLVDWLKVAKPGDEITVKVAERPEE
jgi:hypothetical protein